MALFICAAALLSQVGTTSFQAPDQAETAHLLANLKSDDVQLQRNAIRGLGDNRLRAIKMQHLETRQTLEATLLNVIQESNDRLASDAIQALGPKYPLTKAAVPQLIALVKEAKRIRRVRRFAVRCLADLGKEASDSVPALLGVLKDRTDQLREACCGALGKIAPADPRVQQTLRTILKDKSEDLRVRGNAVEVLASARVSEPLLVSEVLEALGDAANLKRPYDINGEIFRSAVLMSIVRLKPGREAVPLLVRILDDKDETDSSILYNALNAIGNMGPDAGLAVPSLVGVVQRQSINDVIKLYAVHVLLATGESARKAVPALRVLEREATSRRLRSAVQEALMKLGEQ